MVLSMTGYFGGRKQVSPVLGVLIKRNSLQSAD